MRSPPTPPTPPDEAGRLASLRQYDVLDTPPEQAFDDLTALAAHICQAPVALISLVDEQRQWFKSRHGWQEQETPRILSFCAHAIMQRDTFVITDTTRDDRFADNPLVTGGPRIRFYAGCPLTAEDGVALGTLCVLDRVPRELQPDHERALRILGRHVMALLELRRQRRDLASARALLGAEAELREYAARFSQLAEHVNQVFWMTNAEKNELLYVSPGYEQIWGRERQSLYDDPASWLDTIHPDDRDRVRDALGDQAQGTYREQYRIVRPDGGVRWILDRAFPVADDEGTVYRIVGVADDISDQKRLEQELRESEASKRAVWESALDAIIMMDHTGRIVDLNPAAERNLNLARETATGRMLAETIIPPRLRERHRSALRRYLETGEASILNRRVEVPALGGDGTEFPAELTVTAVSTGSQPVFIGTLRDITESRRNQQALLKERTLADRTINSLPGVFYLFDESGRFLRWNENFEKVSGYSADEFRSLHPLDLFRGDDRQLIQRRIAEVFSTGGSEAEALLVNKGGVAVPYYFTGRRIEFDGQPCLIGMGIDISDLKRAEAERDRLFLLAPDMFCIAGFDGYFRQLNPAWEQTLGIPRSELLAKPYLEFVHPEDRQPTLHEAELASKGASIATFENRYRCNDGSFKWLAWTSITVLEEQLIYGVARDVTDQHEASAALHESEERYRTLVEGVQDGIFAIAPNGTFTSVNLAFEAITGWSREQWVGRPFQEIVHADDVAMAVQVFRALMDGDSATAPAFALRVSTRDGGYVPMEITATAHQLGDRVVGVLGIARDVRERQRMEDQLRQMQRLDSIGRLAAGVAHDFNNLLTVQQGHLEMLLAESELPESAAEHVQQVMAAAERAATLTRQLLAFSRKQTLKKQRLNINDIVLTLSGMLDRLVGEQFDLNLNCDENTPSILGDRGMIEQVLMNLVVNARDAMPGGGTIEISTNHATLEAADLADRPEARPGSFACLAVTDSGHGISADLRDRIFDPFFTTKDVGQGTGLGLATVHGIVKQHEGWIEVDSTPGSGATFRVCFPAEAEPEARDAVDEGSGILPAPAFGATILAVEDEKALRAILQAALERHGYRVLIAANGPEALEVWGEHSADIDLLLTDLVMPQGMSGWELAKRLRAERADLKVLIMSGYAPSEQILGGDDGALGTDFGFLPKPYTLKGLARAVHNCLQT